MPENTDLMVSRAEPKTPKLGLVEALKHRSQLSKERNQAKEENRQALGRMSQIGERLRRLTDNPDFIARQRKSVSGPFEGGKTIVSYHLSLPAVEEGYEYDVDVNREKDEPDGKVYRIGVSTTPAPERRKQYTSGVDDGYWLISFSDGFSEEEKKKGKITITGSNIHGDVYLGKEVYDSIESVGIGGMESITSLALRGVDFGGYPSVHVTLEAWGEDPKDKSKLGPIGKIRSLRVLALARALHPVKDHIMDTDSIEIPITDDSLQGKGINFDFARGSMRFGAKKTGEFLDIGFEGQRQRLKGATVDGQRIIEDGEIERKALRIPMSFLDGNKVIDILDRATQNLETSFTQKREVIE